MKSAKARELPLRKHGKKMADRQHGLKRIADIGIDLFGCGGSRAPRMRR